MTRTIMDINRGLTEDAAAFVAASEQAYSRQLTAIADYIAAHRDQ